MKVGLRTIKTAVSATAAIFAAKQLGLLNPASAGIIALLSVTATKKSTIRVGIERLVALSIAAFIAWVIFPLFGYHALSFGLFLLLFIVLANHFRLNEGIPVSSVLISQLLIAGDVNFSLVKNAYMLLIIGVGCALLVNLYMPNTEDKLKEKQEQIDKELTQVLTSFADLLEAKSFGNCDNKLVVLKNTLEQSEIWARKHDDNFLFRDESYYASYFSMRTLQVQSLEKMNSVIQSVLPLGQGQGKVIAELLRETVNRFSKENDGTELLEQLEEVYDFYRHSPLPENREEFEYRAQLFYFLTEFEHFLEIKKSFFKF